ncbi:DNA-directed RNA polymerase core subunit RPB8 [Spizellomyces punctatus DAOM BR117]|uniref:DNA-directed RNA polymerases I, II, and III subunit RPABC3 n=1 Tax=Spizellomyces punctatus (strain DAOM BR117) TaxID=645134 RepID=A0A0L0HNB5_SPIPD|nr:DNA-directed RNA polymerase core subunit RPB8 [Spizellomyces punctatus DAOM BR117]KND02558.1 hypothetical protein SPPG_03016 [Spizellomyces punctatus DAOM BR117]|eukprot:XP_016610597.1 hypothetical protein SPPG_03016 [Spizellomyces punctatus DAOM BR117]
MKNQLFQSTFEVKDMDPFGKKFDRVSRIRAEGQTLDVEVLLDVNTEIYPLEVGDKFAFLLATTLSLDGLAGDAQNKEAWRDRSGERTLADDYDYVMYGKVYKFDDSGSGKVSVYASFGGLLLCITGDQRQMQDFDVGMNLYLLMKK